jgi:hypothetical protein
VQTTPLSPEAFFELIPQPERRMPAFMSADPQQIKDWTQAGAAVITALKGIIGMIPSGPKRDDAQRLLEQAEFNFKKAQAEAAHDLGFEICRRCWRPEIIVVREDDNEVC